jgi:hypothetical protein
VTFAEPKQDPQQIERSFIRRNAKLRFVAPGGEFSCSPHKTKINGLVSQELAAANFQCVLRAFHTSSHGQFRAHSSVTKG